MAQKKRRSGITNAICSSAQSIKQLFYTVKVPELIIFYEDSLFLTITSSTGTSASLQYTIQQQKNPKYFFLFQSQVETHLLGNKSTKCEICKCYSNLHTRKIYFTHAQNMSVPTEVLCSILWVTTHSWNVSLSRTHK